MSDRFFDGCERQLYLEAMAKITRERGSLISAEAADRIAWQFVERYRSRNLNFMMASLRADANSSPAPAAEAEEPHAPESVPDAMCDAIAQEGLDLSLQGMGERAKEPDESFGDSGPTPADLRGDNGDA